MCTCAEYLLWNVIDVVPVEEQLDDSAGQSGRHLLQDVASQVELHQALQVLEGVLSQVGVSQLPGTISFSRSVRALHTP